VEIDGATVGSSPGTFKATPGLHQMRVTRQWMQPWQQTVNIQPGATFRVALELSDAGLQRYRSLEGFRAAVAIGYAEAVMRKGVKINFDTAAWRDVGNRGGEINVQQNAVQKRRRDVDVQLFRGSLVALLATVGCVSTNPAWTGPCPVCARAMMPWR
jgi:hypothetical protein